MASTEEHQRLPTLPFPTHVSMLRFVESRSREIAALNQELAFRHKNTLVLQRLPRHMRRRATSHNPKRLPRKLRPIHESQFRDGPPSASKRPSRKFRRRKRNLVDEYNRRQEAGKPRWLETHLWHSKRFRMRTLWNWRIPWQDNQKSQRSCYRASRQYALLNDLSFWGCLEMSGSEENILEVLKGIRHPDCASLAPWHPDVLQGIRATMVTIATESHQVIGQAQLLWMPETTNKLDSTSRKLWFWVHPSFHAELLNLLLRRLPEPLPQDEVEAMDDEAVRSALDARKWKAKPFPTVAKCPEYSFGNGMSITDLKEAMVRFRIMGPKSSAVLSKVLSPIVEEDPVSKALTADLNGEGFAPKAILQMIVQDPRIRMPGRKTRIRDRDVAVVNGIQAASGGSVSAVPVGNAFSLWHSDVRDKISRQKIPDSEVNSWRRNKELKGIGEELHGTKVPVILIRIAGDEEGYCPSGGWDLLLPLGWGMAFWLPLVYHGVRIGGLREVMNNGNGICDFPQGWPDCPAGKEWEEMLNSARRETDLKRPQNKRTKFIGDLGFRADDPYKFPYEKLLESWGCQGTPRIHPVSSSDANLSWVRLRMCGKGRPLEDAQVCLEEKDGGPGRVIGYVSRLGSWYGDFSGRCVAYALVVNVLLDQPDVSYVLVRNLTTEVYRRAQLERLTFDHY